MCEKLFLYLPCSDFNHDVGGEYVGREENPEDVVEQQTGEQQRRHLQRRQAYQRDERHAQAHAHRCNR